MKRLFAFLLVLMLVIPPVVSSASDEPMTDVGTPRRKTLIIDNLSGRLANPDNFNWYSSACIPGNASHLFVGAHLWEIEPLTGIMYGELAAELPRALNGEMTQFEFKIREGLKWSDGVDFTAYDVEFTGNMLRDNPALLNAPQYNTLVKSIQAVDAYTIRLETFAREPRLEQKLGVTVHSNFFKPVPKHVWEKEDPNTFTYSNPLSLSSYVLIDRDPQGYWLLYQKREDWQNSLEGQKIGEPEPEYIYQRFYGNEEKRIMAAMQHNLDIVCSITPEAWDLLREKSDTIQAWYPNFPYGNFDDPSARGVTFNMAKEPYSNPDVRWALALSIDIVQASINIYNGMLRVTPLQVPPVAALQDVYHEPMVGWLKEFSLPDGYKPYDDTFAEKMTSYLASQGVEGLPESVEEQRKLFGTGWWKYDVTKATELLTRNGFKQEEGKWYLPSGEPWKIDIYSPKDFSIQSVRTAYAVAEAWKQFGIDVNVRELEAAAFWNAEATGEFDVGAYWRASGAMPDVTAQISLWHNKYLKPVGEVASGDHARWDNPEAAALMDKLAGLTPNDPELVPTTTELLKIFAAEIPNLPMFGSTVFVPTDNYYWTGYQTAENAFSAPWWWWAQFKYTIPYLKSTGN